MGAPGTRPMDKGKPWAPMACGASGTRPPVPCVGWVLVAHSHRWSATSTELAPCGERGPEQGHHFGVIVQTSPPPSPTSVVR